MFGSIKIRPVSIALIVLSLALLGSLGMMAQGPDHGFRAANRYASFGLDALNVTNGNLVVNVPIASLPSGRGGSPGYSVSLQYNSKLWDAQPALRTDGNPDENGNTNFLYTAVGLKDSGG